MPRRAAAQVRPLEADSIHRSKLVQQIINKVMLDGKKSTAERIVYDALASAGRALGQGPDRAAGGFHQGAHAGARGSFASCRWRHLPSSCGGPKRPRPHVAVRWLVEFARARREKTMAQRLANELLDAQSQQGGAYKRKDDIYRMAQANKAFAHYRW